MKAKTGFLCRSKDPGHLARAIRTYFAGDLYENLEARRTKFESLPMSGTREQGWGEILDRGLLTGACEINGPNRLNK
jgi:hypothetical protein